MLATWQAHFHDNFTGLRRCTSLIEIPTYLRELQQETYSAAGLLFCSVTKMSIILQEA